MTSFRRIVFAGCLAAACAAAFSTGRAQAPDASSAATRLQSLRNTAEAEGVVRVIIEAATPFSASAQSADARALMRQAQAEIAAIIPAAFGDSVRQYPIAPYVAATVDRATLDRLAASPLVSGIFEDARHQTTLADSGPLIGSTAANAVGYTGSGWAVAIIDTGVQEDHPFLKNKVVAEGCWDSTGGCPGGSTSSTAPGSGSPCALGSGCFHGTHVAGIATGNGTTGGVSFNGVAPGASLIPLRVFNNFGSNAYTSDIDLALQYLYSLSSSVKIASVNMSLGDGSAYPTTCDASEPSTKAVVDQLRSVGVATVVAAGNSGAKTGISAPGCLSNVISVGSSVNNGTYTSSRGYAADTVSYFSQSASYLSLLAPGHYIQSSITGSTYGYVAGTSMATPQVAGAWAVMKQAMPTGSVSAILSLLQSTGKAITDTNGVTTKRIRVDQAVSGGACTITVSPTRLTIGATGGSTAASVTVSGNCSPWTVTGAPSWATVTNGGGSTSATVTISASSNSGAASRNAAMTIAGTPVRLVQAGSSSALMRLGDFDGDGRQDITIYRSSTGDWWSADSSTNAATYTQRHWGVPAYSDVPVPGDYDGDGITDPAIYRPSTGEWWVLTSSSNYTSFINQIWGAQSGGLTFTPVPGDYDGDGKTDIALWQPATGMWWILTSSSHFASYTSAHWGQLNDVPVAADYDGDGKTDLGIWRPSTGEWWIAKSSTSYASFIYGLWGAGNPSFVPVPGDYDGDGKADLAVWLPSTGTWWVATSSSSYASYFTQTWGNSTFVAVPGDYDGDGKTDIAAWQASSGMWWILKSSSAYTTYTTLQWGGTGDIAIGKR